MSSFLENLTPEASRALHQAKPAIESQVQSYLDSNIRQVTPQVKELLERIFKLVSFEVIHAGMSQDMKEALLRKLYADRSVTQSFITHNYLPNQDSTTEKNGPIMDMGSLGMVNIFQVRSLIHVIAAGLIMDTTFTKSSPTAECIRLIHEKKMDKASALLDQVEDKTVILDFVRSLEGDDYHTGSFKDVDFDLLVTFFKKLSTNSETPVPAKHLFVGIEKKIETGPIQEQFAELKTLVSKWNEGTLSNEEFLFVLKCASRHVISRDAMDGRDFLKHAVEQGEKDVARLLILAGADINRVYPSENGESTYLMTAMLKENREMAKLFIEHGAFCQGMMMDGIPHHALLGLIRLGDFEMARLMIKSGANVNLKDSFGQTPLIAAAEKGDLETVKDLLKAGANVYLPDNNGKTPLKAAQDQGHVAVVQLLSRYRMLAHL